MGTTSSTVQKDDVLAEFITPEDFSKAVEYHVIQYKTSYIEAVMEVAERIDLELEYDSDKISKLIDVPLKGKIEVEAIRLRTIEGELGSQLDV